MENPGADRKPTGLPLAAVPAGNRETSDLPHRIETLRRPGFRGAEKGSEENGRDPTASEQGGRRENLPSEGGFAGVLAVATLQLSSNVAILRRLPFY